ncbi:hypothetical protein IFM89_032154 [Coptis chinensis]|uniref:DUF4283 domain-containing protein n=1 Tax=Coptis chinensis TaxID=261450 RepID=A0A835MBB9_9MAGN|nr:hypothetical protein IFM89_032154 [Coptis chinensis]
MKGTTEWYDYVVGFFLEKRLPFLTVRDLLRKRWKLKGNFEMVADEELFYFKFSNSEDRKRVLETGSFYISGRCFVISKWSQDIERRRNSVQLIPIWVNLHNVPKELWIDDGLSYLARGTREKEVVVDNTPIQPESSCLRTVDGEVVIGGTYTASTEYHLPKNYDEGVDTDVAQEQGIDQSTGNLTQEVEMVMVNQGVNETEVANSNLAEGIVVESGLSLVIPEMYMTEKSVPFGADQGQLSDTVSNQRDRDKESEQSDMSTAIVPYVEIVQ